MLTPLLCAFSFLIGVSVSTLSSFDLPDWVMLLPLVLYLRHRTFALMAMVFFFGLWRVEAFEAHAPGVVPYGFIELSGEIVEEIDERLDHQKIIVKTEYGRVLAKISLYDELEFGDTVQISGELQAPSQDIDGFSYANYLARSRIWLVMNEARVKVLSPAKFSLRGALFAFKAKVEDRLNHLFFEPEASFAAGLLLGSRKGMPDFLAQAFQAVGLTHIVAISGYNITLLVTLMFAFLSFLPLKTRVIFSTFAIFLFVILVGANAAVVRAGIMGALTIWALFSGRQSQVFFALLWSGVLMVLMNPLVLVYDVGFQLSFAATLGLLVFSPILEKVLPGKTLLAEALRLTLSAQITTFPLMAYHFGRISLLSPLANVLVAPFLPFGMLFSALSLFFGKTVVLLAWFHLRVVEWVALTLGKIPFAQVSMEWGSVDFFLANFILISFAAFFYKSTLVRALGLCRVEAFLKALNPAWRKRGK